MGCLGLLIVMRPGSKNGPPEKSGLGSHEAAEVPEDTGMASVHSPRRGCATLLWQSLKGSPVLSRPSDNKMVTLSNLILSFLLLLSFNLRFRYSRKRGRCSERRKMRVLKEDKGW